MKEAVPRPVVLISVGKSSVIKRKMTPKEKVMHILPKRAIAITMWGWPGGTREMERRDRPHRSIELKKKEKKQCSQISIEVKIVLNTGFKLTKIQVNTVFHHQKYKYFWEAFLWLILTPAHHKSWQKEWRILWIFHRLVISTHTKSLPTIYGSKYVN